MNQLFQVYKSSAGSGKTFTLVKAYIKLCLLADNYFHFSSILAITFTNKATIEMKERILSALMSIKEGQNEGLLKLLASETKLDETTIQRKCELILTNIVHNYGDFGISTIDRFTHRLIRTFAKDLGLPLNFQVEIDPHRILEESIDRIVSRVGEDAYLSNALLAFAFYKVEDNKSWRIEDDLIEFAGILLKDSNLKYIESLKKCNKEDFINLRKAYKEKNKDFVKKIQAISKNAIQLIKANGISIESFYYGKTGIGMYFEKNAEDFLINQLEPNSRVVKTIEEDKWYSASVNETEKQAIESIQPQLKEYYHQLQSLLASERSAFIGREAIMKSLYTLSLLSLIEKQMHIYKKEERILPIADFNKQIAEVVLAEPMPFIYERLGERYNHFMIDEFQDTSELQFMNLLPLIEESLGRGQMNLIVGDAKQAIYRFRGGEMKQLANMPAYRPENFKDNPLVNDRLQALESQYHELALKQNWRSKDEIVAFNNQFFQFVSKNEALHEEARKVFVGYEQKVKDELNQGLVDIFIFDEKDKELHLEQCLKDIQQALEDGYQYKDVAILCNKNDDASLVANFLQEHHIPVISSEALLLNNAPQVQFMLNIARWVFNPSDILAKKEILVYLSNLDKLSGSLETHLNLCIKEGEDLSNYLSNYGINVKPEQLELLPLHAFFEELVRCFNFNDHYDVYLQFLQEEVYAFTKNHTNNMSEFLDWWDQKKDKLALDVPSNINAVEVLTIHKSKGLEFPVVIMPFISAQGRKPKGYLWVEPLDGDEYNLPYALVKANEQLKDSVYAETYLNEQQKVHADFLHQTYVAFTRAVDRLHLRAYCLPKNPSDESLANLLLQFALSKNLEKLVDDQNQFIWGKRQHKFAINKAEETENDHDEVLLTYHSSAWNEKLKISAESEQLWELDKNNSERTYGNLLHELLAQLSDAEQIDGLLQSYFLQGKLSSDELAIIKLNLTKVLTHESLRPFYKEGLTSKREATLINQNGQILRPDLVVYFEDRCAVIDYKTGEKNESHHQQLYQYVNALEEMTELPIEAYLFYTSEEELVQLN